MTTVQVAWNTKRTNTSLRRQWTVCDASSDFTVKRCLRNNHRNSILRVHILFWTKNLRTFQGLSRTHFPYFSRSPFNAKMNLEYYVFFWFLHNTTNFILKVFLCLILVGTWESGLDKVSTEIQELSSNNCNFQGFSRPRIFILKFTDFQGVCELCIWWRITNRSG